MFKDDKKNSSDNIISGSNRIVDGTKIKGEINSQSDFRIDGEVEGTILTTGRIVVGKTGVIRGKIICSNADIEGNVQGIIEVKNMLSLKATAHIQGEVHTDKLTIEPGAIFNVTCNMGGEKKIQQPINKDQKIAEKTDK